jgi:hypothetical protein
MGGVGFEKRGLFDYDVGVKEMNNAAQRDRETEEKRA